VRETTDGKSTVKEKEYPEIFGQTYRSKDQGLGIENVQALVVTREPKGGQTWEVPHQGRMSQTNGQTTSSYGGAFVLKGSRSRERVTKKLKF